MQAVMFIDGIFDSKVTQDGKISLSPVSVL